LYSIIKVEQLKELFGCYKHLDAVRISEYDKLGLLTSVGSS